MSANKVRSDRLKRFLGDVISGKMKVENVNDVKRLLEAIQEQADICRLVERLIARKHALDAIQKGLRFNTTPGFINNYTTKFVRLLSNPEIKRLCNGNFFQQLLIIIVEPRTLWNAYRDAFIERKLDEEATHDFCWMMTELLSLPQSSGIDITIDAQRFVDEGSVFLSSFPGLRNLGHKIKQLLQMKASVTPSDRSDSTAGGRHGNDHSNFRHVAILPTSDEFICTVKPFYRRAEEILEVGEDQKVAAHVDNQFRLLREDLLSELREDVQNAREKKKGRRPALRLEGLSVACLSYGDQRGRRLQPCTLGVSWKSGLDSFKSLSMEKRKKHLKDNYNVLKQNAFGCLIRGAEIVAFTTIIRDIDKLIADPPVLLFHVVGYDAFQKTLSYLKLYNDVSFLLVETPVFAYEPILRCLQEKVDYPLVEELFLYNKDQPVKTSDMIPEKIIQRLKQSRDGKIQDILNTTKPIELDHSQLESLLAGLTQRVGLVQGPPGTGKSFIGALLAKVFHDSTMEKILVMCYTNHALDQFLEDLLDIGIDPSAITRLGSKSTPRTEALKLSEQRSSYKRSQASWNILNGLETNWSTLKSNVDESFAAYHNLAAATSSTMIMEYLEFKEPEFYEAFILPEDRNGMTVVGHGGRAIEKDYLYQRWINGKTAGVFVDSIPSSCRNVWEMETRARHEKHQTWKRDLLEERAGSVKDHVMQLDEGYRRWESVWNEKDRHILASKRIIGCTTTAAAMYSDQLRGISPGIVLLEEAGEILESHVLTALTADTKQLVLIGDHLQLRPKINEYSLSVEKGDGYDLNVSLFERLICSGYPHTTLLKQHRMCPEISTLVRHLTYPNLEDDQKTKNRPRPRGLQDRVIFFQHEHPEANFAEILDKRDESSKQSKRNVFEAEIVLQIVKYLGQQGYGTDKLVVLTPYLGQLHLLQNLLGGENDPVLNDLDSYDLVKAGLLSQASADHAKRKIQLSTIDNYQGEESDIVIASLTRSNSNGDIGFMAAPQRLNVLLSRARNVLIMVGNANTFISNRKGEKCWKPFIDQIKKNGHLYDGFPVYCERHPDRTAILKTKKDFQIECPEGGCPAPCGAKLKCGIHDCPSKCHQLVDHSKMPCTRIVEWTCSRGHLSSLPCSQVKGSCRFCDEEDRAADRKRERDLKLDAEREKKQKEYRTQLAEAQDELAHLRRVQRDQNEQENREKILKQHWDEIKSMRSAPKNSKPLSATYPQTSSTHNTTEFKSESFMDGRQPDHDSQEQCDEQQQTKPGPSSALEDWEFQKQYLNAQSSEIDSLMKLVGLETVKEKFLAIKEKADVSLRQNVDLTEERFGSVLLGNPGTGKTTVARLYGSFLASIGIIPGNTFVETTGSRLANCGVSGCQKIIDSILNDGGGLLFIDEAYQLVQGSSFGGTQVLDFLLAEVENLRGKIVFILAGYQRPMEKFFAHNPGLPSRFPHELKFDDYSDEELTQILEYVINKKYKNSQMKVEGGHGGLYCRIVARRVGRGRGREGFANARAIENAFAKVLERQSARLKRERRSLKSRVDDFLLTKEDLVGPEPSAALQSSSAWKKLKSMIGLESVKSTVEALLDSIRYNYQRELQERPLVEYTLNRVFLGSPGTGKTSVAKLYGQILVDIGLLSNGEVITKNPSDFVGGVMGESEKLTKSILASTLGKVLVIDEAYGLCAGGASGGTGAKNDIYRSAVVDTIVAEVQSTPGEDRCVLLLGYKDQMQQMFQNVNPGLSRRFPIDQAFEFEDLTEEQLDRILTLKLQEQGFDVTERGRKVVLEMLERARNRPHFGNAGEVDILLNHAKMCYQKRVSARPHLIDPSKSIFDAEDFDEDYDRAERDDTNIALLFQGVVGCEDIVSKLEEYREMVKRVRQLGLNPREQVPFNFLFRGPPGTGKTSTARKMGKVYYDMGLLASAEVIEVSASELMGEYVGQTSPKTQNLLEKALGKVLFIDEAYRLSDGQYGSEAVDELVDCITKPRFAQRLIIILAGYESEINRLMTINPGLTSRFPESIKFNTLSPDDCIELLYRLLLKKKNDLQSKVLVEFDLTALENCTSERTKGLTERFESLSTIEGWANARDVGTLAKNIFGKIIKQSDGKKLNLSESVLITELDSMVNERIERRKNLAIRPLSSQGKEKATATIESLTSPVPQSLSHHASYSEPKVESYTSTASEISSAAVADTEIRDTGVSEEVWNQLQRDKVMAEDREKNYLILREQEQSQTSYIVQLQKDGHQITQDLEVAQLKCDEASRLRLEEERVRHEMERRKQEAMLEKIRKEKEAMEEARRKEQQAQTKLRRMGLCVQGFRWLKQGGGYRCAGGSHWVSDAQLGL